MAVKPILLLGDERLYELSDELTPQDIDLIKAAAVDLHDTMMDFRARYGAGRAIAAPQIGLFKRLIYMHVDAPVVFINPIFENKSEEMMELWDDCMSFPDLLVRVRRHKSCTIRYRDESWTERTMDLEGDLAELLQHEYDHLDGVLAVQRAVDDKSLALKGAVGS